MKKILIAGVFASFLIGIIYFFVTAFIGFLNPIFKPLMTQITHNFFLEYILDILLAFIIVFLVGSIATRIKFQEIYNKYFRRVPEHLESGRGALVAISRGAYFLAIIMKEVTIKKANGESRQYYVLYAPSTPIPMSGLPVIYVEKTKVIPLHLSYADIYKIFGSFGANSPATIMETHSDTHTVTN